MKSLYESILSSTNVGRESLIRAIREWLDEYGVKNYTINGKLEIDVDGDVYLGEKGLKEFPLFIQFGVVKGYFNCSDNKLVSLKGCPKKVVGNFICPNNDLRDLKGALREVRGDFDCNSNNLTSLEGAPEKVGRDFICPNNDLRDLKGAPREVRGDFDCNSNNLTSLKGAPREISGWFDCRFNKTQFTKDDVKKVCKVLMYINV